LHRSFDTLVLFLLLGEMISVFPNLVWFGYRLVLYSLYYVEVHSFES
jgi:hypothetical protein